MTHALKPSYRDPWKFYATMECNCGLWAVDLVEFDGEALLDFQAHSRGENATHDIDGGE